MTARADGWRDEIVDLHAFFQGWLGGTLPDGDGTFERVTRALDPDFTFVTTSGAVLSRERLLASLRAGYGSRPGLEIRIEEPVLRWTSVETLASTYVEHQREHGEETRRRSTALFRTPEPGGVWRWIHVHETWVPSPAERNEDTREQDETRRADGARARAIVEGMLARDAFSRWLGIDVTETGAGRAVATMTVRSDMVNGFEMCHGGITFSLADSAFAFASNGRGRLALALDASISLTLRVMPGDVLTARAEEASLSNRVGVYNVTVTNQQDDVVGVFRGTVYRTHREYGAGGVLDTAH